MTGLLRRSKPWIASTIVDTDFTSCKSKLVKVLCKTNRPYSNGKAVKLVSDGELFIVAIFTDEAVSAALTDHGIDSETGWNSALLILHTFSIELGLQPGQDVGEYVLYVEKFNIWDLQPGYTAKYDVKSWTEHKLLTRRLSLSGYHIEYDIRSCMENEKVWDKMVSTLRKQREKEIEQGNTTTASSAPLTQLLEEMAQFTPQCEEEMVDSKPGSPDFTESLIEKLLQPLTAEEFLIRPAEAEILDNIQEWKDDYCPPASMPVDSDPIAACDEEFDICAGNTLNSEEELTDHLHRVLAVQCRPKVAGSVRLESSQKVNYLGLAVTSPSSQDNSKKNIVIEVDDARQPEKADEPLKALFTQNDVDTQSQATSSQWQNDLDSLRFSFEEDSCSQHTSGTKLSDSGTQSSEESPRSQPSEGLPGDRMSEPACLQLSEELSSVLLSEKFTGAHQTKSAVVDMSEDLACNKPCEELISAQRSDAQLPKELPGAQLLDDLPGTQLSENLPGAQLSEDLPGAQQSKDLPGAQLSEDLPGAQLSEDLPGAQLGDLRGAQLSEDLPGAQLSEDLPGVQLSEDLPGAQLSEDLPGVQLSEDLPGAQLSGDLPDAQPSEDLPGVQLSEDLPGAQLSEDLPGAQLSEDLPGVQLSEDLYSAQLSKEYQSSPMSKMIAIAKQLDMPHKVKRSEKNGTGNLRDMLNILEKSSEESSQNSESKSKHHGLSENVCTTSPEHVLTFCKKDTAMLVYRCYKGSGNHSEPSRETCILECCEALAAASDSQMVQLADFSESQDELGTPQAQSTQKKDDALDGYTEIGVKTEQDQCSENKDNADTVFNSSVQNIFTQKLWTDTCSVVQQTDHSSDIHVKVEMFNPEYDEHVSCSTCSSPEIAQVPNSEDKSIMNEYYCSSQESANFSHRWDNRLYQIGETKRRLAAISNKLKSMLGDADNAGNESADISLATDNPINESLPTTEDDDKAMIKSIAECVCKENVGPELVKDYLEESALSVRNTEKNVSEISLHKEQMVSKEKDMLVCADIDQKPNISNTIESSDWGYPSFSLSTRQSTLENCSVNNIHSQPVSEVDSKEDLDQTNLGDINEIHKRVIDNYEKSKRSSIEIRDCYVKLTRIETTKGRLGKVHAPKCFDTESGSERRSKRLCAKVLKAWITDMNGCKDKGRNEYINKNLADVSRDRVNSNEERYICIDGNEREDRQRKKNRDSCKGYMLDSDTESIEVNNKIKSKTSLVVPFAVNGSATDKKEINSNTEHHSTKTAKDNSEANRNIYPAIMRWEDRRRMRNKDRYKYMSQNEASGSKSNNDSHKNMKQFNKHGDNSRKGHMVNSVKTKLDMEPIKPNSSAVVPLAEQFKNTNDSDKLVTFFMGNSKDNDLVKHLMSDCDSRTCIIAGNSMGRAVMKPEAGNKQNETREISDELVSDENMSVKLPECNDKNQDVEQNKTKGNEGISADTNIQNKTCSKYFSGTESTSTARTDSVERVKIGVRCSPVSKLRLKTCLHRTVYSDGARNNNEVCEPVGSGISRPALDENVLEVSSSKSSSVETEIQKYAGSNNYCDDSESIACTQPFKVNEYGAESVGCTQPFRVNEYPETQEFSPNIDTVDKEKLKHSSSLNTFENDISRENSESIASENKENNTNDGNHMINEQDPETNLNVTDQLEAENLSSQSNDLFQDSSPESEKLLKRDNIGIIKTKIVANSTETRLSSNSVRNIILQENRNTGSSESMENRAKEEKKNKGSKIVLSQVKESESIEKEISNVVPDPVFTKLLPKTKPLIEQFLPVQKPKKTVFKVKPIVRKKSVSSTKRKLEVTGVDKESDNENKRKRVEGMGCFEETVANRRHMSNNKKNIVGCSDVEKPMEHSLGNSFEEFALKSSSAPKQTKVVHESVYTSSSLSSDAKMKCKDRTNRRKFKLSSADDINEKSKTSSENVALLFAKKDEMYRYHREKEDSEQPGHYHKDCNPNKRHDFTNRRSYENRNSNNKPLGKKRAASVDESENVALLFAKKDEMYRFYREKEDSVQHGHCHKDCNPNKRHDFTNMRSYENRDSNKKLLGKKRAASIDKSEYIKDWLLRQTKISSPPSQSTATDSSEQLNKEGNNLMFGFETLMAESQNDISATQGRNFATSNVPKASGTVINIQAREDNLDSSSNTSSGGDGHDNNSGRLSAFDIYFIKMKLNSGWRWSRQKKKLELE